MEKRVVRIAVLFGAAAATTGAYFWRRALTREAERLASILGWRNGATVADVGAGTGPFAIAAARHVGVSGQVFATDIERKKLNKLRKRAQKHGLRNIRIFQADDEHSGLPPNCCDSILLRGSYHHFSKPIAMATDLFHALRPGGVVALIEFTPRWWLSLIAPVKDVPANRGGHGIPHDVLIREFRAVGFEQQETISRWFLDAYCVVLRKPAAFP
jgi:ubiquinone/menaquinone biosynthesis C-methylase UbiE